MLSSLIRPSLGFLVLQAASIIGFGFDNLVIGYALGPEAVTRYAVPFSLVIMSVAAFAAPMSALMPTITLSLARSKREELAKSFLLIMQLAMLYSTLCVVALLTAGPWMIRIWAGPGVFPGMATFGLQIALLFLQVFIEPAYIVLLASTRHYRASALNLAESILNLALSLWWVRRWGLAGVIAGSVVARIATTAWYIPFAALTVLEIRPKIAVRSLRRAFFLAFIGTTAAILSSRLTISSRFAYSQPVIGFGLCVFMLVFYWIGPGSDERHELVAHLWPLRS
jgi:O-antigen/teichoic acid export membrane protein